MTEFWNFKDAFIVAQSNLVWLFVALVIGLFVGWVTCRYKDNDKVEGN